MCLECAATLHRDHRCCPTRDVIDHHGDRIRELISVHLGPRLERLKESLEKVQQLKDRQTSCQSHSFSTLHTYIFLPFFQVEESQEALQARVNATADEVRAFARGYASAMEAHCLSLLHRLEELHIQSRCGDIY